MVPTMLFSVSSSQGEVAVAAREQALDVSSANTHRHLYALPRDQHEDSCQLKSAFSLEHALLCETQRA